MGLVAVGDVYSGLTFSSSTDPTAMSSVSSELSGSPDYYPHPGEHPDFPLDNRFDLSSNSVDEFGFLRFAGSSPVLLARANARSVSPLQSGEEYRSSPSLPKGRRRRSSSASSASSTGSVGGGDALPTFPMCARDHAALVREAPVEQATTHVTMLRENIRSKLGRMWSASTLLANYREFVTLRCKAPHPIPEQDKRRARLKALDTTPATQQNWLTDAFGTLSVIKHRHHGPYQARGGVGGEGVGGVPSADTPLVSSEMASLASDVEVVLDLLLRSGAGARSDGRAGGIGGWTEEAAGAAVTGDNATASSVSSTSLLESQICSTVAASGATGLSSVEIVTTLYPTQCSAAKRR